MKEITHPGVALAFAIRHHKVTQDRFAFYIKLTRVNLSKILNGHAAITPHVSMKIGRVLGQPDSYWFELQCDYEMLVARQRHTKEMKSIKHIWQQPKMRLKP